MMQMAGVMVMFVVLHMLGGRHDPFRPCRLKAIPVYFSALVATKIYLGSQRLAYDAGSANAVVSDAIFAKEMLIATFVAGSLYYLAYGFAVLRS